MRKLVLLFLLLKPFSVAFSQPEDLARKQFSKDVLGHQYILRDFSAQSITRYNYRDEHLEQDAPPLIHSAALFEVKEASFHGPVLIVRGSRSVLVEDKATSQISLMPQVADASIEVDLGASDRPEALPQLIDELFFRSVPLALAAIPPHLRSIVPYRINAQPNQPCKDCKHWVRQSSWQQVAAIGAGLQNPQLLGGGSGNEPPVTSKTATRSIASFAFVVDEKGHTDELWLTRSAGYGLDEFWTNRLRKEVFLPAKYQSVKVAVPLAQDFDYERF